MFIKNNNFTKVSTLSSLKSYFCAAILPELMQPLGSGVEVAFCKRFMGFVRLGLDHDNDNKTVIVELHYDVAEEMEVYSCKT